MDIKRRIGLASTMAGKFNKIWKAKDVSNTSKVRYETFVVPVLLYGSKCWCLRKEDKKKILTVEMTWLRKILCITTRRHTIKNIDIRETLQQKETMVDKIRRRRLTWFGHVSRMDERRKRRRPPKKWIDNTRNTFCRTRSLSNATFSFFIT